MVKCVDFVTILSFLIHTIRIKGRASCSQNGNVDYTCQLLKLSGYEHIINTPPVDLESFLENLLTQIWHW